MYKKTFHVFKFCVTTMQGEKIKHKHFHIKKFNPKFFKITVEGGWVPEIQSES